MSAAATLSETLQPLRADPARAGVLLDVDGTLAPIVRHADDAAVPEPTRALLIQVARRYACVACVSGRQASVARQIVSIGSIAYIGNHGVELLRPGGTEVELDREVAAWEGRIRRFADEAYGDELRAIAAFHWRGAPDEQAAERAVRSVAERAEAAGLRTHWGRKVLEVRPSVDIDKGRGIRRLLRDADLKAAVYVGDDRTDIDAFAGLRTLVEQGRLGTAACVGVRSDETPRELEESADTLVDGTAGVRQLLEALL
jgi:trehalose 6-phosphate phosphatase